MLLGGHVQHIATNSTKLHNSVLCAQCLPYTAGLLKIGKCTKQTKQDMLPPELQSIVTPFKLREWSRELSQHPDKS